MPSGADLYQNRSGLFQSSASENKHAFTTKLQIYDSILLMCQYADAPAAYLTRCICRNKPNLSRPTNVSLFAPARHGLVSSSPPAHLLPLVPLMLSQDTLNCTINPLFSYFPAQHFSSCTVAVSSTAQRCYRVTAGSVPCSPY